MMKGTLTAFVIGGAILLGMASVGSAQETGMRKFVSGSVIQITGNEITISEYDVTADAEKDVTYSVNPETVFENLDSVEDIRAGDEIEVEYAEVNGQRIVKNIYKADLDEELDPEGEYGNEATE
jgi:ribosomal protein S4